MENQGMADVWVATQNVDGVCRRAGSKKIIKLHGNIFRVHRIRCGYVGELSSGIKGISDIDYTNEFNSNGKKQQQRHTNPIININTSDSSARLDNKPDSIAKV
jgi:hypothetical protein